MSPYSLHVVFIVVILLLFLVIIVSALATILLFFLVLVLVVILYMFRTRRRCVLFLLLVIVVHRALATLLLPALLWLFVGHVSGSRVEVLLVRRVIESRIAGCHDESTTGSVSLRNFDARDDVQETVIKYGGARLGVVALACQEQDCLLVLRQPSAPAG